MIAITSVIVLQLFIAQLSSLKQLCLRITTFLIILRSLIIL